MKHVWLWVLVAVAAVLLVRFIRRRRRGGAPPKLPAPLDAVRDKFIQRYPTWAYTHAQQLLGRVSSVARSEADRQKLLDCIAGAHPIYFSFEMPREIIELIGGADRLAETMFAWPREAQSFYLVASGYIKSNLEKKNYEHDIVASLREMPKTDKPYEPIAVYLSVMTANKLGYGEFDAKVIATLYEVFFDLQQEQMEWLQKEILG